jgi:molecular chaperone HtpG
VQVLKDDYQYFPDFMKDFVRNQVYPRVQQFVPSSTRQGVDALRKILERNRELYRYEETETGELEIMLQDLLPSATMAEVLQKAQTTMRVQTQRVTQSQVGTVEHVIPDVAKSPNLEPAPQGENETEFSPRPPILREEITSDMKILIANITTPGFVRPPDAGIRGFLSYTSYNSDSLGRTPSYLHLLRTDWTIESLL